MLDGRKVHLIVSDVDMPRMDGLTFLRLGPSRPTHGGADPSHRSRGAPAVGAWPQFVIGA